MYKRDSRQIHMFDITLEDTFTLNPSNRWVQKAKLVPWELAEAKYEHMFAKNGRPAKSIRMALGALIIQQTKGLSDEETVQEIMESPYLQHFIGMSKFSNQAPFDPSLMVWFRKRLSAKFMTEINDAMCKAEAAPKEEDVEPPQADDDEPHGGTLILDATCAPADIAYPTDTGLIREAVEKSEEIIDILHEPHRGERRRPRTYRKQSRRAFVGFVKQRKPSARTIRQCKRKQLGYLRRNLCYIHKLIEEGGTLPAQREKQLKTLETLYTQQLEMYEKKTHRVDDRIVSIAQPHIRPIVRGKAGTPVEFGAKIDMSVVNGYVFLNKISYDAFSEGGSLEDSIIDYYTRFGVLPKEILADQAYRTRENRALCKELGIRLMGKPLGRPPKDKSLCPDTFEDAGRRVEIEGKFGTLKTGYGWNRIMARLPETSISSIWVAAFAMNLTRRARLFLRCLRGWLYFEVRISFSLAA